MLALSTTVLFGLTIVDNIGPVRAVDDSDTVLVIASALLVDELFMAFTTAVRSESITLLDRVVVTALRADGLVTVISLASVTEAVGVLEFEDVVNGRGDNSW